MPAAYTELRGGEMEDSVHIRGAAAVFTMDVGEGALGDQGPVSVVLDGGRVSYMGPESQAPSTHSVLDATGCCVFPGLVDCHTHAVWAGSRSEEFRRRLSGVSYSSILEEGGGILSTVAATRAAPLAALVASASSRLSRMAALGVTTVEVKSGYGLNPSVELQCLVAARLAGEASGLRVVRTFLGAHTVPAEHRGDRAAYVDQVIEEQLPLCAPEADFIDVYVDRGAFEVAEGERILRAGAAAGLGVRIHAEQCSATGAAAMAARLGAQSADHLEHLDTAGIEAMAAHGTVGVVLPGAMLYLRDAPPPVAALRDAGVPLAVATDLNPGSSPVGDLWACATLACLTAGFTVEEALLGITARAADALGRPELGRIRVGGPGDVVVVRPPPGEPPLASVFVQHLMAPEIVATFARGVLTN
jgi:imidazolonepropionase